MIEASDMVPLLVEASPQFRSAWLEFQAEWSEDPSPPHYELLADFVRHLSSVLASGDEETLKRVFAVVERLHVEGTPYVRQAATVGILEDLQNVHLHESGTTPEQFERFLLPVSAKYWRKVQDFWATGQIITDD